MIFQIWFQPHAQITRPAVPFVLVDLPRIETVSDLFVAMGEDSPLAGHRLQTRFGEERGVRLILGREPLAFRAGAIERAERPTWTMVEEGAAA
ncbi:hypothetical protein DSD19_04690 [Rhodovulum sp. BSW8]|uniref:hypothetical protein n=1 Tax=Rhodovulum sp. BSW8 TaxID=2259645 RepID=UPI000DE1F1C1|nr:hypothetical protein [Rhodovulum sp. BSW8]RBO54677.1 hypothetical protein DSD19_04690 [Rhodovulum sp. BSW8]